MERLILFVVVVTFTAAMADGAVVVYDLAADWSDTNNPNGVWSYNDSIGPITVHQSTWPWPGQDVWARTSTGPGHIVAWMKTDSTMSSLMISSQAM